jgi:Helicase associated domain
MWVATQRTRYKGGKLSNDRTEMLESIALWTWSVAEDRWCEMFEALQAFAAREGNARIPSNYVVGSRRLRPWIVDQRSAYSNHRISPERIAMLESLPAWEWHPAGDRWNLMFEALERFVAREGHANVPPDHVEGSLSVGQWCQMQRALYRRGTMLGDHISAFERLLGWTWNTKNLKHWSSPGLSTHEPRTRRVIDA